jgi:hypothetical protein
VFLGILFEYKLFSEKVKEKIGGFLEYFLKIRALNIFLTG